MTTPRDDVVRVGDGWLIRAERAQGGHSATFQVLVRGAGDAPALDSPHRAFAGARAWLALAQERLAAGDAQAALDAARAGLAELGQSYYSRSLGVTDDTSLHIALAEEMVMGGKLPDAARRMVQALNDRLQLYARLHADAIGG